MDLLETEMALFSRVQKSKWTSRNHSHVGSNSLGDSQILNGEENSLQENRDGVQQQTSVNGEAGTSRNGLSEKLATVFNGIKRNKDLFKCQAANQPLKNKCKKRKQPVNVSDTDVHNASSTTIDESPKRNTSKELSEEAGSSGKGKGKSTKSSKKKEPKSPAASKHSPKRKIIEEDENNSFDSFPKRKKLLQDTNVEDLDCQSLPKAKPHLDVNKLKLDFTFQKPSTSKMPPAFLRSESSDSLIMPPAFSRSESSDSLIIPETKQALNRDVETESVSKNKSVEISTSCTASGEQMPRTRVSANTLKKLHQFGFSKSSLNTTCDSSSSSLKECSSDDSFSNKDHESDAISSKKIIKDSNQDLEISSCSMSSDGQASLILQHQKKSLNGLLKVGKSLVKKSGLCLQSQNRSPFFRNTPTTQRSNFLFSSNKEDFDDLDL